MKTISKIQLYQYAPDDVFRVIDDLGVTGSHMTKSSAMMMGSKLQLEYLSANRTGLNCKYRWSGKMMGITMDFTVIVTKWVEAREKVWETVGPTKLIIYSWYRMKLKVRRLGDKTEAALSISYKKPEGYFQKILCFLLADWYCRWCLKRMLGDASVALAKQHKTTEHALTL